MKNMWILALAAAVLAFSARADLNGKNIVVKAGGSDRAAVPVSLDCPEAASGPVTVLDSDSGASLPATLTDGKLTFVVDRLAAGEERVYTVKTDAAAAAPRVAVEKTGAEEIVDVVIDGKLFTRYHYGAQWKKPFLWPINTEGGVTVTRDYPMNPEGTPKLAQDHPHHKSLWTAYGEVRLVDGPPEPTHDLWAEGGNSGNQRAKDVTWGSGDAYGWIKSDNVWETGAGAPLIRETREYRFYAVPEKGRFIDVKVTFTAEFGDAQFKDTKEGGIVAVRMRHDICNAKAVITNAHGDEGEKTAWGKPSPWCDFSGESPEAGWLGLAVFDNPGNLRHPSSWHVRNYGLMGANAFGYSYFSEQDYNKGLIPENGDLVIKKDDPVTFNYRVYVHRGNAKEAAVADRYTDYVTPPEAAWK